MPLVENLNNLGVGKTLNPRAVVEKLGHHITRCTVPLQLKNMRRTLGGDCQQINELAVVRRLLPATKSRGSPRIAGSDSIRSSSRDTSGKHDVPLVPQSLHRHAIALSPEAYIPSTVGAPPR
jgi:hypothetical protein